MEAQRLGTLARDELEELVRCHGWIVMKVAERFTTDRDEVDELFQTVWVRVIKCRDSFSGIGAFEAWLYRVALNVCIDEARKRTATLRRLLRVAQIDGFREFVWQPPLPDQELVSQERHDRIREAVKGLPPREAQAIRLVYFEQMSRKKAAEEMGITEATVRSLLRNGVNRLKMTEEELRNALS